MTTQQLKEHFNSELINYQEEVNILSNIMQQPDVAKKASTEVAQFIKNSIYLELISELPGIIEYTINKYNKDLNFVLGKEDKIKYLEDEIRYLGKVYNDSPFANWFTTDNFHNEIFTKQARDHIIKTFLIEISKVDGVLDNITNGNLSYLGEIGKKKRRDLVFTFHIIIKAKVLKIEYKALIEPPTIVSKADDKQNTESTKEDSVEQLLQEIWIESSILTVNDFLQIGVDGGLWDENYNLITGRGSLYGTGKTLLGSLSLTLRGYAIKDQLSYTVIGEKFCKAFNILINSNTKQPYKVFSSGNTNIMKQLRRLYKIN